MESVGVIRSGYKQRFAIPRQPGLSRFAVAEIILNKSFSVDAVKGLDEFSHLWIVFKFHETKGFSWKEMVRPPRLGGKEGRGVFATRSPFRPNPIGLSVVKLKSYKYCSDTDCVVIAVEGGDFLDGTPVYDVKPYVPYSDCITEATSAWAHTQDVRMDVILDSDELITGLPIEAVSIFESEKDFIFENISLDPRPAHERGKDGAPGQTWGAMLGSFDVKWKVEDSVSVITKITLL